MEPSRAAAAAADGCHEGLLLLLPPAAGDAPCQYWDTRMLARDQRTPVEMHDNYQTNHGKFVPGSEQGYDYYDVQPLISTGGSVQRKPLSLEYEQRPENMNLDGFVQSSKSVGNVRAMYRNSTSQNGNIQPYFIRSPSPCSETRENRVKRCMSPYFDSSKRALSPVYDSLLPSRYYGNAYKMPASFSGVPDKLLQGGVCCQHCNKCLIEFKRQALRLICPEGQIAGPLTKVPNLPSRIEESLQVPENIRKFFQSDRCDVCETHLRQLKHEAVVMVQSIQQAQVESGDSPTNLQALVGSNNIKQGANSYQRTARGQTKGTVSSHAGYMSSSISAQLYLDRAWVNPKKYNQMLVNRSAGHERLHMGDAMNTDHSTQPLSPGHRVPGSPCTSSVYSYPSRLASPATSPQSTPSAAASFFARAAQKLSISSKKKKKHQSLEPEQPVFPTSYCEVIRVSPPPAPPCLMRTAGRMQIPGVGKVKVMMRICPSSSGNHVDNSSSILMVDQRKKQLILYDPAASGYTTAAAHRRAGTTAPKMFGFDAVFSPDDSLSEICSSSLTDIVQGVVNGADGCLFTFGYSRQSKAYTMLGKDQSAQTLGIVPCAITWLFKLINEQKEKTGARFSVRVSAVEVSGKQETLKDLLADVAQGTETGVATAPGVYLREDPICGTQLENQSELRAPTAERAAYYLDAAIAARASSDDDDVRHSHLLFTLHVYQYRIEKANKAGFPGVAGGRSRLHLIDLGSCSKSKDPNNVFLSLSALGNVILALLNGQRHIPHRDAKIAQLLRESLGNLSCRTCMIAHVSSAVPHYNETLQVIQLAARIHRMRRRKTKFSSTSSEDSSNDETGRMRRPLRGFRMGTLREDMLYSSSHSDPDYTSSSEQSCDTVIYVGANGHSLSDRELTDNEGPPRSIPLLPRTNPRIARRTSGSRSSGDEGSNSDSGRSLTHSDYSRIPRIHPAATESPAKIPSTCSLVPPQSIQEMSLPLPNGSLLNSIQQQQQRKIAKAKLPSSKLKSLSDSEKGISAVRANSALRAQSNSDSSHNEREQWIDGPGAAIYSENKKANEQWVDGPQAFVVRMDSPWPDSRKHLRNAKVDAEEHWIDGPKEMISKGDMQNREVRVTNLSSRTPMHNSKKMYSQAHESIPEVKTSPHHPRCPSAECDNSTRSLRHHTSKHTQDNRPESTLSIDSNVSVKAEPSGSRPVSMHSNSADGEQQQQPNKATAAPEVARVKPFVKDWVEKHSGSALSARAVQSLENETNIGFIVDAGNQVIGTLESFSNYKKAKVKKTTVSSPKHTPLHSPKNSPASMRKCKEFTGYMHTSSRVTEWLKSVSSDQPECLSKSMECLPVECNICDTQRSTITSCSALADQPEGEELSDKPGKAGISQDGLTHDQKYLSICSSSDTNKESNPDAEFANLLISNRESIYEIQVDQQLESVRRNAAGNQTGDIPDDETFSNLSCSKDEEDRPDLDELYKSHTFQNLNNIIIISAEPPPPPDEPMQDRIQSNYDFLKYKKQLETVDENKPLCSRNPDGASNPNLTTELFQEEGGAINVSVLKQNYTINPSPSHHIYTIPSQILTDKTKVAATSAGQHSQSVCGQILEEICELNLQLDNSSGKPNTKMKPPLPQKMASKSNGANKSSIPSPPTASKVTALPKQGHTKDSGLSKLNGTIQSKLCSSSSSHNSRNKDRGNKSQRSNSQPPINCLRNKTSKSQSAAKSRLPIFTSNNFVQSSKESKSKKKEKASTDKLCNGKVYELSQKSKGTDSDSGNDSGIVTREKKFLSPYATVTKPRAPSHSSSGHGSDNSSTISTDVHSQPGSKSEKLHGGTSSGYESMLRDSEATASSSAHDDTASESSSSERKKGSRKKKLPSTRRSRSAPARTSESPSTSRKDGTPNGQHTPVSASPKAWVDTRNIQNIKDEPFEIRVYDVDHVERMQRRRQEEMEVYEQRRERVRELLNKQEDLKQELASAKERLMIERSTWSFDLFVAEQVDYDDPNYLEALEQETFVLEKRVDACKSHLMMVTSFDIRV